MTSNGGLAPIQRVLQMAKKTFARAKTPGSPDGQWHHRLGSQDLMTHLKQLSDLMHGLTARDLGLDQSKVLRQHYGSYRGGGGPENGHRQHSSAPVTYIGLHEDSDVTMGVFIINPRGRMPLHNHPGMHGILKVVHGTVEVSFYNRVTGLQIPGDLPEPLRTRQDLLERDIVVPAGSPTRVTVGPESEPLVLYPNQDNFHEIRLIGDGPAAFLDILSPPYNCEAEDGEGRLENPDDERRDCGFYQSVRLNASQGGNPSITWLHRLKTHPPDYQCDFEPYMGPSLDSSDEDNI